MVALSRALAVRPHLPNTVGYTVGKYYGPSIPGGAYAATAQVADNDYFVPFLCRKTTTFDRIALYNTGAEADNFRLGIYADDGGGHPGTLLVDGGQLTASGAAGDNAATISQSLTVGTLYWLVFNCATAITVQTLATGVNDWANLADFAMPTSSGISGGNCFIASRAYAAFPSTATAISGSNGVAPLIRLRAA